MNDGVWRIKGDASLQAVLESESCPRMFERALSGPLSWQMRNETSVQKALRVPRLAPLWETMLLALGAVVVEATEEGERETPLAQADASHMVTLHVPTPFPGQRWGVAQVARTPADEPIVAAVAVVGLVEGVVQAARVALSGVWPEVARLAESGAQLVGHPLDDTHIQSVAAAVEAEVDPQADFRGSVDYRRAMAAVLTRRVLNQCAQGSPGGRHA